MKIAVVTPTYRTPGHQLDRCLRSVAEQTFPCTQFLVCDGDYPPAFPSGNVKILTLPESHGDYGNAARSVGSVAAICEGFDAIAYLDADNWFEPRHIESLVEETRKSNAAVCTSGRNLYDTDGQLLGPCTEVDGENFVDTSCFMLTKAAFAIVSVWYLMPRSLSPVGDRIIWKAIKRANLPCRHTGQHTVNYTTTYAAHYTQFRRLPPPGCKDARVEVLRKDLREVTEWLK